MATPSAKSKAPAKVASLKLARHLTMAVKQHLLANGVEPACVNEEVLHAALRSFDSKSRGAAKSRKPGEST